MPYTIHLPKVCNGNGFCFCVRQISGCWSAYMAWSWREHITAFHFISWVRVWWSTGEGQMSPGSGRVRHPVGTQQLALHYACVWYAIFFQYSHRHCTQPSSSNQFFHHTKKYTKISMHTWKNKSQMWGSVNLPMWPVNKLDLVCRGVSGSMAWWAVYTKGRLVNAAPTCQAPINAKVRHERNPKDTTNNEIVMQARKQLICSEVRNEHLNISLREYHKC